MQTIKKNLQSYARCIDYHWRYRECFFLPNTEALHWCYIWFVHTIVYFEFIKRACEKGRDRRKNDDINMNSEWYGNNDVIVEPLLVTPHIKFIRVNFSWERLHNQYYRICFCSELHATYSWYFTLDLWANPHKFCFLSQRIHPICACVNCIH